VATGYNKPANDESLIMIDIISIFNINSKIDIMNITFIMIIVVHYLGNAYLKKPLQTKQSSNQEKIGQIVEKK
jgi:hypothetical protein